MRSAPRMFPARLYNVTPWRPTATCMMWSFVRKLHKLATPRTIFWTSKVTAYERSRIGGHFEEFAGLAPQSPLPSFDKEAYLLLISGLSASVLLAFLA